MTNAIYWGIKRIVKTLDSGLLLIKKENNMTQEDFDVLVNTRLASCRKVLTSKTGQYASKKDRLHNFKLGAALVRQTPAQYAMQLTTKHIVALSDKIVNNETMTESFITEKIGDIINYMLLIEAINQEKLTK